MVLPVGPNPALALGLYDVRHNDRHVHGTFTHHSTIRERLTIISH